MKRIIYGLFIIVLFVMAGSAQTLAAQTEGDAKSADTAVEVSIQAKYPGGQEAFAKFIIKNFIYPKRCKKKGINGYVNLQFIVDDIGNVSEVIALDDTKSCPEFTEEAIRVVAMSKWIPGSIDGVFYKSYRTIPIILQIK